MSTYQISIIAHQHIDKRIFVVEILRYLYIQIYTSFSLQVVGPTAHMPNRMICVRHILPKQHLEHDFPLRT